MHPDTSRIRTLFLQMVVRSESMVRLAIRSVVERDPRLAREVIDSDTEVDRLELELDRACLARLAVLANPPPEELRLLTGILKMVVDLERIGDLAVNISERGIELSRAAGMEPPMDLVRMAWLAADMVRQVADAFVMADSTQARALFGLDKEIDELNRRTYQRLIGAMGAHPDQVDRALALTSISKHIERVGDHACNLAEMVVFVLDAEDLRHSSAS